MVIFSIACAGKVPDISNVLFPFMRDGNPVYTVDSWGVERYRWIGCSKGSTKRGSSKSTTMSDDDIRIALFMDGGILSNAVTVTFSNALPARSVIIGADGFVVLNTICGVALDFSELKSEISSVVSFRMLSSSIKNTVDDDVIDMLSCAPGAICMGSSKSTEIRRGFMVADEVMLGAVLSGIAVIEDIFTIWSPAL